MWRLSIWHNSIGTLQEWTGWSEGKDWGSIFHTKTHCSSISHRWTQQCFQTPISVHCFLRSQSTWIGHIAFQWRCDPIVLSIPVSL